MLFLLEYWCVDSGVDCWAVTHPLAKIGAPRLSRKNPARVGVSTICVGCDSLQEDTNSFGFFPYGSRATMMLASVLVGIQILSAFGLDIDKFTTPATICGYVPLTQIRDYAVLDLVCDARRILDPNFQLSL